MVVSIPYHYYNCKKIFEILLLNVRQRLEVIEHIHRQYAFFTIYSTATVWYRVYIDSIDSHNTNVIWYGGMIIKILVK
jgi:hypothetical protein